MFDVTVNDTETPSLIMMNNVDIVINLTTDFFSNETTIQVADLCDGGTLLLNENNPPAEAGEGVFVEVCDEATQAVYDKIWTNIKK